MADADIVWLPEYAVGVEELDQDHKRLFVMLHKLDIAIQGRLPAEYTQAVLDEMVEYYASHFRREESYLETLAYPALPEHRRMHQDFIVKVMNIDRGFRDGRVLLSLDLRDFLHNWLTGHILHQDLAYVRYREKKTAGRANPT